MNGITGEKNTCNYPLKPQSLYAFFFPVLALNPLPDSRPVGEMWDYSNQIAMGENFNLF